MSKDQYDYEHPAFYVMREGDVWTKTYLSVFHLPEVIHCDIKEEDNEEEFEKFLEDLFCGVASDEICNFQLKNGNTLYIDTNVSDEIVEYNPNNYSIILDDVEYELSDDRETNDHLIEFSTINGGEYFKNKQIEKEKKMEKKVTLALNVEETLVMVEGHVNPALFVKTAELDINHNYALVTWSLGKEVSGEQYDEPFINVVGYYKNPEEIAKDLLDDKEKLISLCYPPTLDNIHNDESKILEWIYNPNADTLVDSMIIIDLRSIGKEYPPKEKWLGGYLYPFYVLEENQRVTKVFIESGCYSVKMNVDNSQEAVTEIFAYIDEVVDFRLINKRKLNIEEDTSREYVKYIESTNSLFINGALYHLDPNDKINVELVEEYTTPFTK